MKIFYFAPENSGVAFYRFYQPLEELREQGLIELRNWGFDFTGKIQELPKIEEVREIIQWADVVVVGRRDDNDWLNLIKLIKTFGKQKILLDIDDNIYSVSPYLPAHIGYNPNGQQLKIHEEIAKLVDGIIVSTEFLANLYKKFNRVTVVPNGVKYILEKKQHDGVNIGYLCSNSHLENSQLIEPAIIRILQKYEFVTFYYTRAFSGFMDKIPDRIGRQVNYLPFFPLKDYLKYVNNIGIDIGLAPLMVNDFNRAKSNIRVLEYWQNRMAVIASPLDEYSKTIKHGFNGYLADDNDWDYWLEDLVTNPYRRDYLAQHGTESLVGYDIAISAKMYYNILRETIDEKSR